MNTLSALPIVPFQKPPEEVNAVLPDSLALMYWPFRFLTFFQEEKQKQIRRALTDETFPGNALAQSACLRSEVCDKRMEVTLDRQPWLVFWHQAGFCDPVMQIASELVCHKHHCSLCHESRRHAP